MGTGKLRSFRRGAQLIRVNEAPGSHFAPKLAERRAFGGVSEDGQRHCARFEVRSDRHRRPNIQRPIHGKLLHGSVPKTVYTGAVGAVTPRLRTLAVLK